MPIGMEFEMSSVVARRAEEGMEKCLISFHFSTSGEEVAEMTERMELN
jgi:hypothetical protein